MVMNNVAQATVTIPTPILYLDAEAYPGSGNTWTANVGSDATLINTPTYVATAPTYFDFDDVSGEYATVPDLGSLATWTVESWFRADQSLVTGVSGNITAVVCNEFDLVNRLNFSLGTNRQPASANICAGFFDGAWRTTDGFTVSGNTWYHLVGTYDGSTVRQYVDGTQQSTLNYSGTPQSGGEVRIASRWDSQVAPEDFFPGDIGLVRIWNSALSASQVQELYEENSDRFTGPVASNLVLNLDAAEYSGSGDWLDTSGNGNDAALQGTPTWNAADGGYFDLVPGEGDWFSIADAASLDSMSEITIETWINLDTVSAAGPNMLFSKRATTSDGYVGFLQTTGYTYRFGTGVGTGLTYSTSPTTGAWQQVVATIGSGGSVLYINGASVTTSVYTGTPANVPQAAALDLYQVNPRPQAGPVTLDGKVSIFRIYDTVLSSAQVTQNFNAVRDRYGL